MRNKKKEGIEMEEKGLLNEMIIGEIILGYVIG